MAKTCINFSYLKETLKDLEAINPEEFHPKKHISHLTKKKQKNKITIDYLSNNSFVSHITYIIFNFLINNNLISDFPNFKKLCSFQNLFIIFYYYYY